MSSHSGIVEKMKTSSTVLREHENRSAAHVEKVAEFVGIPLDEELKQIVLRQSDIEFMQEHKGQFEERLLRKARSAAMRLPPDGRLYKVRNGRVGESKGRVPDEIKKELNEIWLEEITATIGLKSYEDLLKELMMCRGLPGIRVR